jgi:aryl-alcohol dehydrogenase-like predicted oxidoreductase/predicted kinase
MRLSTATDRDDARAIDVLHAAFDGGVTLLDTADAYCLDNDDTGHNERLVAHAVASWGGDRSRIAVATKGGLTRPGGEWVPNGKARHLRDACEASVRALGVSRIHLYQLHAPDPRTPLATSVRALDALKREGLVERIGLCNVNLTQIEEARRIAEISAVQVEISLWHQINILNGVLEYCTKQGIQLIAYRPLGGTRHSRKLRSDSLLRDVAARHGATPAEIALAWVSSLSDRVVPIPGATKLDSVRSVVRSHHIRLTNEDCAYLNEAFRGALKGAPRRVASAATSTFAEATTDRRSVGGDRSAPPIEGEIVLIMGLPGAGKSTVAREFVDRGYVRLNRDEAGGSLRALLPGLEHLVRSGTTRVVLDNTYVSRASRALVVQAGGALGLPVRCIWLSTSIEAAQVNAAWRMVSKYGRLLEPEEMRKAAKRDINSFAPGAQFRTQRELEPPDLSEGFSQIETRLFERTQHPAMTNKALIVWCDDVDLVERAPVLRRYHHDGWMLLALAWRPQIADQTMTREQVEASFERLRESLGVPIDILYCPHGGGPPVCWCRKPLPGLGVILIQRYQLNPAQCLYVGSGPQDPGFARRLGFQYRDAKDFF